MKQLLITMTAIVISCSAFAQTELTGNWTFKDQESISGNLYGNGSPTIVKLSVADGSLVFEKVSQGENGDQTVKELVKLNGSPTEIVTASKRKKVTVLKKENGVYTETVTYSTPTDQTKLERRVTDKWYVEGEHLVLDRKDENMDNGEVWESKATYIKN